VSSASKVKSSVQTTVTDWSHLTAVELGARAADGSIALWPIGATEQHGPHLVTGFDHLVAEVVVRGVADELGSDVVVLPALAFGCSRHWVALGATLSISTATLEAILTDVCRCVGEAGIQHLILINGHAGNVGVGLTVTSEFYVGSPVVEFVSYWDLADAEQLKKLRRSDEGIGHAGEFETSVALYLDGLLRSEAIPKDGTALAKNRPGGDGYRIYRAIRAEEDAWGGIIGNPSAATADLGRAIILSAVKGLVAHCEEIKAGHRTVPVSALSRGGSK
jgi:creatinine amidohydrolase